MTTRNEIAVDYWAIELDNGENLLDLDLGDAVELRADTKHPGLWVLTALRNDEGAVTLRRGKAVEDCATDPAVACEFSGTRHAHPVDADGRVQPSPRRAASTNPTTKEEP